MNNKIIKKIERKGERRWKTKKLKEKGKTNKQVEKNKTKKQKSFKDINRERHCTNQP
jgi:hypothetical protein